MKRAHSNNEALERYLVLPGDFKSFSIYCLVEDNNDIFAGQADRQLAMISEEECTLLESQ